MTGQYKCQRGQDNGCLTCAHSFEPLTGPACNGCQRGRNCPVLLSISYDQSRPACDGCHWEAGAAV